MSNPKRSPQAMTDTSETANLTDPQKRVLAFMDEFGPRWFTLTELDQIRLLQADDVVTIPSLIERHLVRHLPALQAVTLTAAGAVVADEIRSEQARAKQQ